MCRGSQQELSHSVLRNQPREFLQRMRLPGAGPQYIRVPVLWVVSSDLEPDRNNGNKRMQKYGVIPVHILP
jgi:hypothetical protein